MMFTVLLNRRVRSAGPNSPCNGQEGTVVAVAATADAHLKVTVAFDGEDKPMRVCSAAELVLLPVGSAPKVP